MVKKIKVIRHSSKEKLKHDTDIYIVDAHGEVSSFIILVKLLLWVVPYLNMADKPLEPARFGNHIINGPNVGNFKEIYKFLKK